MNTRATFLGRFQPLHRGHYRAIQDSVSKNRELVISIGSPQKSRSRENPLNLKERKNLLNQCFPDLEKIPIPDEDRGKEGYPVWGRRLVDRTNVDTVITKNPLVKRIIRQETDASVEEQQLYSPEKFSGTEIRKRIRKEEDWRHLVPECSREQTEELADIIRRSGS